MPVNNRNSFHSISDTNLEENYGRGPRAYELGSNNFYPNVNEDEDKPDISITDHIMGTGLRTSEDEEINILSEIVRVSGVGKISRVNKPSSEGYSSNSTHSNGSEKMANKSSTHIRDVGDKNMDVPFQPRGSDSLLEVSLDKKLCILRAPTDSNDYEDSDVKRTPFNDDLNEANFINYDSGGKDLMNKQSAKNWRNLGVDQQVSTPIKRIERQSRHADDCAIHEDFDYNDLLLKYNLGNGVKKMPPLPVSPIFEKICQNYEAYPAKLWVKDKRWWLWKTGVGDEATKAIMVSLWFAMADVPQKPGIKDLNHVISMLGKDYGFSKGMSYCQEDKVEDSPPALPNSAIEIMERLVDVNQYVLPFDPVKRVRPEAAIFSQTTANVDDDDDYYLTDNHTNQDTCIGVDVNEMGEPRRLFVRPESYYNHAKYVDLLLSKLCQISTYTFNSKGGIPMVCTCPISPAPFSEGRAEKSPKIANVNDEDDGDEDSLNDLKNGKVPLDKSGATCDEYKEFGEQFRDRGCSACTNFYYKDEDMTCQMLSDFIQALPQNLFKLCRSWSLKDRRHPMWKCKDPLKRLRPYLSGTLSIPQ